MIRKNIKSYYTKEYFYRYSPKLSLAPFLQNKKSIKANYLILDIMQNFEPNKTRKKNSACNALSSKKFYLYSRLVMLQALATKRQTFFSSHKDQTAIFQNYHSSSQIINTQETINSVSENLYTPLPSENTKIYSSSSKTTTQYQIEKKKQKLDSSTTKSYKKSKINVSQSPIFHASSSSTHDNILYPYKSSSAKRPEHVWCIALAPVHLQGLDGIAKAFGKGKPTVRAWHEQGAPIVYDGNSYFSEYNTLFAWFLNNSQ